MNQIITTSAITMTSLELLELVNQARIEFGENTVRHNDFVARCRDELDGEYYESFVVKQDGPGRPPEALRLTRDQCELVAMRESKGVRRAVRDRLKALEAKTPDLTSDEGKLLLIQELAAKQLATLAENKQLAAERDHAIATKAQIGSSREAQAMAKASSAVRQVERLKADLGRSSKQATVKAVEHATNQRFPRNAFAALRRWCKANNVQATDVPDDLYGTVKAWLAGAWLDVYGIDLKVIFPHFTGEEVTHA